MAITYDEIHELLRKEKQATDLQPLDEALLDQIKDYFTAKKVLLDKQSEESGVFFSDKKVAKIKDEIDNAKRVLKDLYEKREHKCINRATFTVRTDSKLKDTTNMLPVEEELYTALVELLKSNQRRFLAIFRAKPLVKEEDKLIVEKKEITRTEPKLESMKIIEEIPKLVDSELKEYGPFAINDIVELPEELADVLVKQGKAARNTE